MAADVVRRGSIVPIKPNDITVDATVAWLTSRLGSDLTDRVVAVVGTGNWGFKVALRLTEIGCRVHWSGRNLDKVEQLQRQSTRCCRDSRRTESPLSFQIEPQRWASAVTAEHIVGPEVDCAT